MPAPGCTGLQVGGKSSAGAREAARRCTPLHRDHASDHGSDHATILSGPRTLGAAQALLVAIAGGSPASFDLALRLSQSVVEEPVFRQAVALAALLRGKSPFALVRAVALAEAVLADNRGRQIAHDDERPGRSDHLSASSTVERRGRVK